MSKLLMKMLYKAFGVSLPKIKVSYLRRRMKKESFLKIMKMQ